MSYSRSKVLVKIMLIFGFIIIMSLASIVFVLGDILHAAASVSRMGDGIYYIEYRGDYGFDGFLAEGGAETDEELSEYVIEYLSHGFFDVDSEVTTSEFGCSTVKCDEAGSYYYGRNFDWDESELMLVHTLPTNGYESISSCSLKTLGFDSSNTPVSSFEYKIRSIASIYAPVDGMNEKGLIVADLYAGDNEETNQNSANADLTTFSAARLLLDKAATVDEAIDLLRGYDMHSSGLGAHHLYVADAEGNSIVIEYVNNRMFVTRTDVLTNHYMSPVRKHGTGSNGSHVRFEYLFSANKHTGKEGALKLMRDVAMSNYGEKDYNTLWTCIYDPTELKASIYKEEDYNNSYSLRLGK